MEQFLDNLDMQNLMKSIIENDSDYADESDPEFSNLNTEPKSKAKDSNAQAKVDQSMQEVDKSTRSINRKINENNSNFGVAAQNVAEQVDNSDTLAHNFADSVKEAKDCVKQNPVEMPTPPPFKPVQATSNQCD